jgi:hypothetical protein
VLKTLGSLVREGNKTSDGKYRYYRPLEEYFQIFQKNAFQLKYTELFSDQIVAIYLFEKEKSPNVSVP